MTGAIFPPISWSTNWEAFYHSIGMPVNMKELGIEPTEEQIREMAARCIQACGGSQGSAKVLYQADMEAIYRMAR